MNAPDRTYEVTVFGATGFTGGLTAEYLARHAPADLRWAVAGRNREKLEALRTRLLALGGGAREIGVVEASLDDPGSLARMAAQTRVLLTTVGPFIDYGEPVARACVEQGTDYIDSTGEPHFVELLLARYAAPADARGVRLVPSCGFDSIPADLGALFTVSQLPAGEPIQLRGYVSLKGTFSGGTERSAIKSLAPPAEPLAVPKLTATAGRKVEPLAASVQRRADVGGWVAPLPTIDASVVLRSAAALDAYGPAFGYAHHAVHGSFAILVAATLFFGTLAWFARIAPLRALLLKLVKPAGTGPTEAQMRAGRFKVQFVAECAGKTVRTEVSGGDPGYGETSKMLAESALCLARDRAELPTRAGVLTPASAMGALLLARLQRAGLQFRVC
jgi:saccharopine dehydrogenase (NAD+, L-glutamate forming)